MPNRAHWFAAWIYFAVFCQWAGWTLSAFHSLNKTGYAIFFALAVLGICFFRRRLVLPCHFRSLARIGFRFRRPLPLAFLTLAFLTAIGGLLYPPVNVDGIAFRSPRTLHWLAAEAWHWIQTDYGNLNTRGISIEWMSAPLFLFTRTDRFECLINLVCFLLLPGRVFAILTRLGATPRAAWFWMWIFPASYGFVLQAGSIGSDLLSALWPMGAIEFALRAREKPKLQFIALSILCAALMTSAKAFNLLLLPAWIIALLPSLRLPWQRPLVTAAVCALAAGASLLPTALLNQKYCGDWTGLKAEPVTMGSGAPLLHIGVNTALVSAQNLVPPIFPFVRQWNGLVNKVISPPRAAQLANYFEPDAAHFSLGEILVEEQAGLGLGTSLLVIIVFARALFLRSKRKFHWLQLEMLIPLAALAGAFIFMARSGLSAPARYLLPFYLLVLAPILSSRAFAELARRKWWINLSLATVALSVLLLVVYPGRPLWPALSVLRALNAPASENRYLLRAWKLYATFRIRADLLGPIRDTLPTDAKLIGLAACNQPELGLWRPFGSRRLLHIPVASSRAQIRARGIQYILANAALIPKQYNTSLDQWTKNLDAEILQRYSLEIFPMDTPEDWILIRFRWKPAHPR